MHLLQSGAMFQSKPQAASSLSWASWTVSNQHDVTRVLADAAAGAGRETRFVSPCHRVIDPAGLRFCLENLAAFISLQPQAHGR